MVLNNLRDAPLLYYRKQSMGVYVFFQTLTQLVL